MPITDPKVRTLGPIAALLCLVGCSALGAVGQGGQLPAPAVPVAPPALAADPADQQMPESARGAQLELHLSVNALTMRADGARVRPIQAPGRPGGAGPYLARLLDARGVLLDSLRFQDPRSARVYTDTTRLRHGTATRESAALILALPVSRALAVVEVLYGTSVQPVLRADVRAIVETACTGANAPGWCR